MNNYQNNKHVVLRDEKTPQDSRFLDAQINDKGDLVFHGQDLGSGVEDIFDFVEYEWYWTIKQHDIPKLEKAIDSDGNIVEQLNKDFSDENASNLYDFLKKNEIPFDSWSRTGD